MPMSITYSRLQTCALLALIIWSGSCISIAQSSASTAPRAQQAINIINTALGYLGGYAALSSVTDTTVSGTCQSTSQQTGTTSTITWTTKGQEFRYAAVQQ